MKGMKLHNVTIQTIISDRTRKIVYAKIVNLIEMRSKSPTGKRDHKRSQFAGHLKYASGIRQQF